MGTPIAGKPHTSPLVGTEKVPLSPDGYATTQEIANLAGVAPLSYASYVWAGSPAIPIAQSTGVTIDNWRLDVSQGSDITLDADTQTFHLAGGTGGRIYILQAAAGISVSQSSLTWLVSFESVAGFIGGDGIGLTAKDSSGYRLRKDGKTRVRLEYLCVVGDRKSVV